MGVLIDPKGAMLSDLYERLLMLSKEDLALALVAIAERHDDARASIEGLVRTPNETVQYFTSTIAALKRARRFVPRSGTGEIARELSAELAALGNAELDPRTGVELVDAFFGCAEAIFDRCDDSNGSIGDVFRFEATSLFVDFAARCDDTAWLREIVVRSVLEPDGYGISDLIASRAAEFLPAADVRVVIDTFLAIPDSDDRRWTARGVAADLAVALGDPELYKSIRTKSGRTLSDVELATIARLFRERGDVVAAREHVDRIPDGTSHAGVDQLRMNIYKALGDRGSLEAVAWRAFRRRRHTTTLDALLAIVGSERRSEIVAEEMALIFEMSAFSVADAEFLLDVGATDEAGRYVVERASFVDVSGYGSLESLAKRLTESSPIAASILYRALIDSILRRGKPKVYGHAITVLAALEKLAPRVVTWGDTVPHEAYMQQLLREHGRKTAFWSKLEARHLGP